MVERRSAPQHIRHANQAGSAGDCTSSADSSRPWQRLGRFVAATALATLTAQSSLLLDQLKPSNPARWLKKYRAGLREAEDRCSVTQQNRLDSANRLSTNLRLALFKYQDAERKAALYHGALIPKADQNLKVIQRSFEAGKSDFLSLIDAERILLEFQLT